MSACVLDTDVIIGALDTGDAHHRRADALIGRLVASRSLLVMSVVNYAEALVKPAADDAALRRAIEAIADIGVDVVPAHASIGADAARFRVHRVSLADGFALATARHLEARIATFDDRVRQAARDAGVGIA
ncbi:MAG: type II toxin-antitoxin system VapC family toxin [Candidatus Dormibacteria bacterium]